LLSSSLGSPEPESTTNEATYQHTNETTIGQINEGKEEEGRYLKAQAVAVAPTRGAM